MTTDDTIERAALAHYEAYFEILIDDLEPSWKGADDSHRDRMISAMQSALSTLRPGDRLPGGLVVVPEVPTDAMLKASSRGDANRARVYYRAMLASARGEVGK